MKLGLYYKELELMTENSNIYQNPSEVSTSNQDQVPAANSGITQADKGGYAGRKVSVAFLIFLGAIFLLIANVAFWAGFTLLNTDRWVAVVGPLTKDPTVSSILSQYIVAQLFEDIDQAVKDVLPPEIQKLSGPLVAGLQKLADDTVTSLIQSDAFNNVWVGLNRLGHTAVMKVLKGEGDHLYFQDGNLELDLSNVYDFVEKEFGLTDLELIPEADQGRLVLFHSQQVAILQEVVSYLTTFAFLMPLLTLLAFVLAWFVSLWRRETLIWIGIVSVITMVVSLVILQVSRTAVLTSVQNPMLRDLGREIWYVVTHGLMVQTIFLMIAGVLLSIGAWQSAPDSALMKWEASRKEKEAAKEVEEEVV
jgi:hypothetical protein